MKHFSAENICSSLQLALDSKQEEIFSQPSMEFRFNTFYVFMEMLNVHAPLKTLSRLELIKNLQINLGWQKEKENLLKQRKALYEVLQA